MLKLADNRWVRTASQVHIASRHQWQTHRWDIAGIEGWIQVDPDEISTGDQVELKATDLAEARGLGIWSNWVLNERWARVDQLHLYARDFQRQADAREHQK